MTEAKAPSKHQRKLARLRQAESMSFEQKLEGYLATRTEEKSGHIVWISGLKWGALPRFKVDKQHFTPQEARFYLEHKRQAPHGLERTCEVPNCISHWKEMPENWAKILWTAHQVASDAAKTT